jgi:hypothetical protein
MQLKRKIAGAWHLMPDTEYSLCGDAFDGEDADDPDMFEPDVPCKSAREITCVECKARIDAVRELLRRGIK